ncbi:hypothetical protein JHK87_051584 [Glycine soja]|nr:hypothetical protein JHK87_051584 [Glycine soja]
MNEEGWGWSKGCLWSGRSEQEAFMTVLNLNNTATMVWEQGKAYLTCIAHRRRREEKKDVGGEQSTETGEGQSNNNQGSREKSGGRGNE